MNQDKVVIRQDPTAIFLMIVACVAFVAGGYWMWNSSEERFYQFIGIVSIIFFGGGGVFYLLFMSWKPIVTITKQGVETPMGWKSNFVEWSNVDKIEIVTQTVGKGNEQHYVGIFVHDNTGIAGAGRLSQKINQVITDWDEMPAVLISVGFGGIGKINKILDTLLKHHEEYKASYIDFDNF